VSKDNFSFSAATPSKDIATYKIDKKFSELTENIGFSPIIVDSLQTYLRKQGYNIDSFILKEAIIESPSASIEARLGNGIGASANAQIAALKAIIETPQGEMAVRLKAGLGFGAQIKSTYTQKGTKGKATDKRIFGGAWDLIYQPKSSEKNRNTEPSPTIQLSDVEKRAKKFVDQRAAQNNNPSTPSNDSTTKTEAPSSDKDTSDEIALLDETVKNVNRET
jgi:hypothetical protein